MPLTVLVVGAGPAGTAAAVQLVRLGARVLWWDRLGKIGGLLRNARRIENWPGMPVGVSGMEACRMLQEHAAAFGLFPRRATAVSACEQAGSVRVTDHENKTWEADAVIWAVGTEARPTGLENPKLPIYNEFHSLKSTDNDVLFIGGGEAACDMALHAVDRGHKVTVAIRSGRLRAQGRLAAEFLACDAINRLFGTTVESLAPGPGKVTARLRKDAAVVDLEVHAVVAACGRVSALAALGLTGPPPGSGLRRSARMWVVGDARLGGLGQGAIAVGDGLLAASEICHPGSIPFFPLTYPEPV